MMKFDALIPRLTPSTRLLWLTLFATFATSMLGCQRLPEQGVERGELLYNNCRACHGDDGHGREEYGAPAIAGLGAWYVEGQLNKYRKGHRGQHADDIEGVRMRPSSKMMRNEDDIKSVALYVAQLEPIKLPPKTVMDGDPGRGADYFKTCVACHGADGNGMQALGAPSLVVTQDWYQLRQLQKFQKKIRGAAEGDVTGSQMAAMINAVPDEQAKKDVVAYIQKLKK